MNKQKYIEVAKQTILIFLVKIQIHTKIIVPRNFEDFHRLQRHKRNDTTKKVSVNRTSIITDDYKFIKQNGTTKSKLQ